MLRQPIAAKAAARAAGYWRWVDGHYDINRNSVVAYPAHRYCIIDTEFDAGLLEKHQLYGDEDEDEDLAIVNQTSYHVNDEVQLYAVLASLGVAPASCAAPWHVEHPLL